MFHRSMPTPIKSHQRPSHPMIAAHRGRSVAAATRALALAALLVVLATALGLSALAATQRGLDASSAIQAATGVGGAIVALRAALWSLVAALVSAADGTSRFAQRAEAALRERAPLLARRLLIGAAGASLVLAPLPASAVVWSPDGAATAVADAPAAVNSQERAAAGAAQEAAGSAQEAAAAPASATHASAHPLAWPTPAARPEPTSARTPPQKRVQREARVPARAAAQSPTFPHASTEATSRTTGTRATVGPGDTLWGLTAAALPHASDADLVAAWPELHALNRDVIGADPHLLTPGSRLEIPAARHDGRAFDTSTTTRPESR